MNAMIIDDARAMRAVLSRALKTMGVEVREACDGQDGLNRLAEGPVPQLTLVDWNMPNMNGLEFIKAVRADHKYDDMVILMVTTEVEMHRVQLALEAGENEYLMKPFTNDLLRDKLSMLGLIAA